ncbi:hypothetical protein [Deinococcus knuensis]|uniref:Uncharacterized protein n=1 Tax=Deinococcus knuensis TaxID=1837380 RepID=A0ABQ2SH95_9DEIO|nr:hypothetical protein [Deinococcus knuensis]GGS25573.1 hypothetical protein GCM10008961_16310 [Deinococcus knuensis]
MPNRAHSWPALLLVADCAAAGAWRLSDRWRAGHLLGAVISAGAVLGYVLTRSVGLPGVRDDIGNWAEPAGTVPLLLEIAFVVLAAAVLIREGLNAAGRRDLSDLHVP